MLMHEFDGKLGCEEFYNDPDNIQLALGSREGKITTFISENLFMVALEVNGVLVKTVGTVVKAEQIEMDMVKVTTRNGDKFYQLGEDVKWMELGNRER